jgi:ABC-type antimicrobial peptide transport system permease subunit
MDGAAGFETQEIVGVVRNAYLTGLERVQPTVFRPLPSPRQFPKLLIRGEPTAAANVGRLMNRIDPRVAVQATSLSAALDEALASSRYGAAIAAALGLCALGLATVGTFGVFAYAVRRRTREIGVRIALGATPSAVVRLLLVGHSRALLYGLCAGIVLAIPSSLALRANLYGLSPFDPPTYAGVAVTLGIAAVVASYEPVRRAARVDPMTALRDE